MGAKIRTWVKYPETGIFYVMVDNKWKSSGMTDRGKAIAWARSYSPGVARGNMTLKAFSVDFFVPGRCGYIASRENSDKRGARTRDYWDKTRGILVNYLLPEWGDWPLETVSAPQFFEWLHSVQGKRYGGRLSNRVRKVIRQTAIIIWDWAVFRGVLKYNQLLTVPKVASQSAKTRAFRDNEVAVMFEEGLKGWPDGDVVSLLRPAWGVVFLILAETGMRPQEALALYWEDYRPHRKAFIVHRAVNADGLKGLKTSGQGVDKRAVGVSDRLAEALKVGEVARGPLFQRHTVVDGKPALTFLRVDTAGKAFCRTLDRILTARNCDLPEDKKVWRDGRTLYSLRHGANTSILTRAARSEAQAKMGHTTDAMTDNYDDPDDEDLLARIGR